MAVPINIFSDTDNHVLLNPRLPLEVQTKIRKALNNPPLKNHIWLPTSGTEHVRHGALKIVALSKHAFFIAAESVCKTFGITSADVYANTLPLFHVGGLSTLARAHVVGSTHVQLPISQKWQAAAFRDQLQSQKVTITSLVPTQIFDIVAQAITAPSSLRLVFVGGGAIASELEVRAKELGWRIVSTYGMTETAAMLAHKETSTSEEYTVFPHITGCRTTAEGALQIQSGALFSGYAYVSESGAMEFVDPLMDGWFTAGDRAIVRGPQLVLLGRETELVKIKGESVSLSAMNLLFEQFCLQKNILHQTVILAVPAERDGYSLCLVTEGELSPSVLQEFNFTLLPFQKILRTVVVDTIPRTALGKVDLKALQSQL